MSPNDTRKFNISIPLNGKNTTVQKCAYLSHDLSSRSSVSINASDSNSNLGFTIKSDGCETLSISDTML